MPTFAFVVYAELDDKKVHNIKLVSQCEKSGCVDARSVRLCA